ncbi:thioredoxin [Algoriphagus confluentis]|uniref:Thioredoxin n=1 Tax=Algoriphagus confluentis TaxID=1697556 RepID=A0ABQ6PP15_9BACT|nr:thioredoxin [Algoriphagus confluentis]
MSSQAKTFQELIDGETPVLVDFFADWCGPCKMMQPILEDTSRQMGDKVKIVKVDVDRNPLAASKFQVRGVPTLILFRKGMVVWRQSGVVPVHQLVQILESNLLANS